MHIGLHYGLRVQGSIQYGPCEGFTGFVRGPLWWPLRRLGFFCDIEAGNPQAAFHSCSAFMLRCFGALEVLWRFFGRGSISCPCVSQRDVVVEVVSLRVVVATLYPTCICRTIPCTRSDYA